MKGIMPFFVLFWCFEIYKCVNLTTVHNFRKTSTIGVNSNNPPLTQVETSPQNSGIQQLDKTLMKQFQEVILETLKSLSKVNGKLASYFVQHHPSLTQIYKNMTAGSPPLSVIPTPSIRNLKKLNGTEKRPIMMKLSEFVQTSSNMGNSMNADIVHAGSMSADKVNSKIVQARQIVAKEVFVNGNRQKTSFRVEPPAFAFHNSNPSNVPNGFGLIIQKRKVYRPTWPNRRNYFPPRQVSPGNFRYNNRRHNFPPRPYVGQDNSRNFALRGRQVIRTQPWQMNQRNFYIPRKNINSQHRFASKPPTEASPVLKDSTNYNSKISESRKSIRTAVKTPTKQEAKTLLSNTGLWYDEWSDSDELSDEYYDDEYDDRLTGNNKQFVVKGGDITAETINAKKVFAGSVKASIIDVPKIIAKDVIVSAKYGRKR